MGNATPDTAVLGAADDACSPPGQLGHSHRVMIERQRAASSAASGDCRQTGDAHEKGGALNNSVTDGNQHSKRTTMESRT